MTNIILCALLVGYLYLASGHILKQTVILSRHNVRTPLSKELAVISPKPWPNWSQEPGELTAKGALLEGYMGNYFALWLKNEGIIKNSCPDVNIFYAYANNKQRTIASAEAFADSAFPNCDITVHHEVDDNLDPNFNPVIHNSSQEFNNLAKSEMMKKLSEVKVERSLGKMQDILHYKESDECKQKHHCDLIHDVTTIHDLVEGLEPEISGPLHIGNSAVDTFKMEYYEGFPINDVAWGLIKKPQDWDDLMDLNFAYHTVRFNTSVVATDIARPLIVYMRNIFENKQEEPKVTLLMGHDANLITVFCSLDFKPYVLPNQHESTPIGGKVVFQKWYDEVNKKYLLKIEYIYQSSDQLRLADELDMKHPPQYLTLELNKCTIDENGFCPWEDFMNILKTF